MRSNFVLVLAFALAFTFVSTEAYAQVKIDVDVDIKPTSCPNPLNINNKGNLSVAVVGTTVFDVTEIDVLSVKLRAESKFITRGVAPIKSAYEDISRPKNRQECTTEGPNTYVDLTLKFDTQAIVEELGKVSNGEVKKLILTGTRVDARGGKTPIEGCDHIRVKSQKNKASAAPPAFSPRSKLTILWAKIKLRRR